MKTVQIEHKLIVTSVSKGKYACMCAQSCPTLCNPLVCNPPGSSVRGILQARILEWVAISFSRGIFLTQGLNQNLLRLLHWEADSLLLSHWGSPKGK